jgi:hypothetical protein
MNRREFIAGLGGAVAWHWRRGGSREQGSEG